MKTKPKTQRLLKLLGKHTELGIWRKLGVEGVHHEQGFEVLGSIHPLVWRWR